MRKTSRTRKALAYTLHLCSVDCSDSWYKCMLLNSAHPLSLVSIQTCATRSRVVAGSPSQPLFRSIGPPIAAFPSPAISAIPALQRAPLFTFLNALVISVLVYRTLGLFWEEREPSVFSTSRWWCLKAFANSRQGYLPRYLALKMGSNWSLEAIP